MSGGEREGAALQVRPLLLGAQPGTGAAEAVRVLRILQGPEGAARVQRGGGGVSDVPSLDVFRARATRGGGWTELVRSLSPNEPCDITDVVPNTTTNQATMVREAARKQGREVRLRTVNGRVWACWLVDES